jgi:hypothetical protein
MSAGVLMQRSTNPAATRMIWGSLLVSVVIYTVLAFVVVTPSEATVEDVIRRPVVLVLYGLAGAAFLASFLIPRMLLGRREHPPAYAVAPDTGASPKVMEALIVRWALAESAAIFGLVAAFGQQVPSLVIPPAVLSFLGMIVAYPSAAMLEDLASGN